MITFYTFDFNYVIQWWVIKFITLICIQVNQIYLAFSQSAYFDRIVKHSPCTYIRALMGKHTLITAWRTIVIIHAVMVVIIIPSLTNAQELNFNLIQNQCDYAVTCRWCHELCLNSSDDIKYGHPEIHTSLAELRLWYWKVWSR